MPSKEFMERVLGTGSAEEVEEPQTLDETPEVSEETAVEDSVATEEEEPLEEGEGPEEADEQPPEEEEEQAEQEDTTEAAQEEEFYLGRYKNRDEAEKGWLEKEAMISRQGDELQQMRQTMAEMQGYMAAIQQQPAVEGEFEAWAEQHITGGNAWGGAEEALDAALSSGDPIFVDAYIESWKEHDPFEAARFRTMVDNQIAAAQRVAQQEYAPPPPQQILNHVWLEMASEDADLADPEIAKVVGTILRNNVALKGAATSGDPDAVRNAISVARDGYRMHARTADSGTPRKVKSSDAERTAKDKLDATVTTGDSSPERGNGSTPEVPPELQEMMQRIQGGEGGFPKLKDF